jgi:hypothetical protein
MSDVSFGQIGMTFYMAGSKIDWIFLFIAIVSLFAWYFSSNALVAVIILTFMNVVGFAPTIRKSYSQPFSEGISFL